MTLSSYFESKLKIICSLHCKILTSAPRTRTPSRARPSPTSPTRPTVINHNMNLQTALIINTLSKVLPNVPQSRLKNQPRLESVGAGIKFHQEEIFIFHTTLTELHVSFGSERSLRSADVVSLWVGLGVPIMHYSFSEEFLRVPKSS